MSVVERQQLPDKKIVPKTFSCLKLTKFLGREKPCVNVKTVTDNLNSVVHRYRNKLYLKDDGNDLMMTEYQSLLAKRVCLLRYFDIFFKRCIVLDETLIHK